MYFDKYRGHIYVWVSTIYFPIMFKTQHVQIRNLWMSCNMKQVVLAAIRGSEGKARLSHRVLKRAILMFYSQERLFPSGIVAELEAVQDWARKSAKAIKRLVF